VLRQPRVPRAVRPWRAAVLALLGLLGLGPGCVRRASAPPAVPAANLHEVPEPRFFPPPFALAVAEDAVVRIVGPQMTCTGALIDDDLVLTAHHCVVQRGDKGEFTNESVSLASVHVELGGDYLAWGDVGVSAIVAPPCGEAGGAGDLAVLVLKHKLVGLATLTLRLEGAPRVGEEVDLIGFGRCAMSSDGIHRQTRSGWTVMATTGETIHARASVCPGDSGGPVVARGSKDVVGVVSMSVMDGDERTPGPTVMARIDAYRSVFAHARLIADGTPSSELPPLSCAADDTRPNRR
jgi:V8-like Glu-specific endopeptidase